jgi:hypothetical protein
MSRSIASWPRPPGVQERHQLGQPAGAHPSRMPGQPPCVGQRAAQREIDLGVCAAQFVVGPSRQGVMNGRIQLSLSVADRMVER